MAAGDAVIKGTNDFTEQPSFFNWVRGKGWQKVRMWEGPLDVTKINTLTTTIRATNAETIDVRRGWPTVVTATYPSDSNSVGVGLTDENTQIEWSLEPYDLEKQLGTHGKFNETGSSPEALAVIDKEIKSGKAYGKDYDTIYTGLGEMTAYARLKSQGVDTYLSYGFLLRKTLTCERDNVFVREYQQRSAQEGRIITWTAIQVPDSAFIERPTVHLYDPDVDGFIDQNVDEWFVKPIAIRMIKEGRTRKRQLIQQFLGAWKWSKTLYDGGSGTP